MFFIRLCKGPYLWGRRAINFTIIKKFYISADQYSDQLVMTILERHRGAEGHPVLGYKLL